MYIDMFELPWNDPRRSAPLLGIRAEVRNRQKTDWRPITASWKLAERSISFNQLENAWIDDNAWRVPAPVPTLTKSNTESGACRLSDPIALTPDEPWLPDENNVHASLLPPS